MTKHAGPARPPSPLVLALPALLALAAVAAAQPATEPSAPGFATSRFERADPGSDWFTLESLDTRGHLRLAYGLATDWAHKPLVLYDQAGQELTSLVRNQWFLHFGGAVVLAERVRVGLAIPIAIVQDGAEGLLENTVFLPAQKTAFGDIRLAADVRLLGEPDGTGTLAIGGHLFLPTGRRTQYTSDGVVRFAPRVSYAGETGKLAYAARVGLHFRDERDDAVPVGNELAAALAVGVHALDRRLLIGPELVAATSLRKSGEFLDGRATPLELLLGGHYALAGGWRVGAAVGPGLSRGPGAPSVRMAALAEYFAPGPPPDSDRDGVPDPEDACPLVPGLRTGDPKTHGCPPPPDSDKDGIPDPEDACPAQAGPRSADPKAHGCPPPPDTDGDGIIDAQDACPLVRGLPNMDAKLHGCPPPPPDRDKDQVPDGEDACPDTPGPRTADPKTSGCPPDRDGDTIPDPDDACPDQAGPRDLDPKKSGCPLARVEEKQIKIVEQVKFQTKSAKILPESEPIIQAVADILKQHAEIKKLRIEGHTDIVGSAAYNKRLSGQRAAAVADALVKRGVDKKRLKSAGLGKDRPIADNTTEEGRRENRRVEFHIEE